MPFNTPFYIYTDPHSLLSEQQERWDLSKYIARRTKSAEFGFVANFSLRNCPISSCPLGRGKSQGRWSCLSNCKIPTQFVTILSHQQNTKPTKLVRNEQENPFGKTEQFLSKINLNGEQKIGGKVLIKPGFV